MHLLQSCREPDPLTEFDDVLAVPDRDRLVELASSSDRPAGLEVLWESSGSVDRRPSTEADQLATFFGRGVKAGGGRIQDRGRLVYRGSRRAFSGEMEIAISENGVMAARVSGGLVGRHSRGRSAVLRVVGHLDAPGSAFDGDLILAEIDVQDLRTYRAVWYRVGPDSRAAAREPRPAETGPRLGDTTGPSATLARGGRSVPGQDETQSRPLRPDDPAEWMAETIADARLFAAILGSLWRFNWDDAEEATEEALVKLLSDPKLFKGDEYGWTREALEVYLKQLARSLVRKEFKQRATRVERLRKNAHEFKPEDGLGQRCALDSKLLAAAQIAMNTMWLRRHLVGENDDVWPDVTRMCEEEIIELFGWLGDQDDDLTANAAAVRKHRHRGEIRSYLRLLGFPSVTATELAAGTKRPAGVLIHTVLNQSRVPKLHVYFHPTVDLGRLDGARDPGPRLVVVGAAKAAGSRRPLHEVREPGAWLLFHGKQPLGQVQARLRLDDQCVGWVLRPGTDTSGKRGSAR